MNAASDPQAGALSAWADALRAAALLAIDPWGLGGAALHAAHGPVRDQWLHVLRQGMPAGSPWRRLPLHAGDDQVLGGLDLTATLAAGRPIAQSGLLAQTDGGILVVAMAERVAPTAAARLCAALDSGETVLARDGLAGTRPARFGVVALDEGTGDDPPPPGGLLERLAFRIDLTGVAPSTAVLLAGADDERALRDTRHAAGAARERLSAIRVEDEVVQALCATAEALGVSSMRAVMLAVRAARAAAAIEQREQVGAEDAALAARLVLAPRATRWPQPDDRDASPPPEPPPPPEAADPGPDNPTDDGQGGDSPLEDVVLEAARVAIPAGLLAALGLTAGRTGAAGSGRAGVTRAGGLRGRPSGVRPGLPRDGARLAVVDTLRAAAPWQRLRQREAPATASRLRLRASDLRVARLQERSETTTIFALDASGSSALHRLAEAKGAVEMLLADCYVRRDRVAVLAFRGRGAEVLLPPTRSLVRAKRSLAGLPGGGGTPLATGIDAARALAEGVLRRGGSPLVVLLTDGRANVARDGTGGRGRAEEDARDAARRLRASGCAALWIDTSPQPQAGAAVLAGTMGATYVPLPRADAAAIAGPVRAAVAARGAGRAR